MKNWLCNGNVDINTQHQHSTQTLRLGILVWVLFSWFEIFPLIEAENLCLSLISLSGKSYQIFHRFPWSLPWKQVKSYIPQLCPNPASFPLYEVTPHYAIWNMDETPRAPLEGVSENTTTTAVLHAKKWCAVTRSNRAELFPTMQGRSHSLCVSSVNLSQMQKWVTSHCCKQNNFDRCTVPVHVQWDCSPVTGVKS